MRLRAMSEARATQNDQTCARAARSLTARRGVVNVRNEHFVHVLRQAKVLSLEIQRFCAAVVVVLRARVDEAACAKEPLIRAGVDVVIVVVVVVIAALICTVVAVAVAVVAAGLLAHRTRQIGHHQISAKHPQTCCE